jgi:uncharacterized protein YqgC (DUF456 family)
VFAQLTAFLSNGHLWGFLTASIFILAGFVGVFFPVLPGTLLILAGFLCYGLIAGFAPFSPLFFIGQAGLVVLSYLVDFLATAYGVKRFGGSSAAAWGAVLGSLLIFVIGPFGIVIGPLLGAMGAELLVGKELRRAVHSGFGSFIGFLGGTLAKLIISCIMTAWFVLAIT